MTVGSNLEAGYKLAVLKGHTRVMLLSVHFDGQRLNAGTALGEDDLGFAVAVRGLDGMYADFGPDDKALVHELPIGLTDGKAFQVFGGVVLESIDLLPGQEVLLLS